MVRPANQPRPTGALMETGPMTTLKKKDLKDNKKKKQLKGGEKRGANPITRCVHQQVPSLKRGRRRRRPEGERGKAAALNPRKRKKKEEWEECRGGDQRRQARPRGEQLRKENQVRDPRKEKQRGALTERGG